MNRLFTFGCSYTAEFDTNIIKGYDEFKKYRGGTFPKTWSTLLGEKLNMEVRNYGVSAAGNQSIFDQFCIHSDEIEENDIVIIGWSFVHRYRWAHHDYNKWHFFGAGPIDSIMKTFQDKQTHEKITYNRTSELYFDEVFNYIKLIDVLTKAKNFKTYYWFSDQGLIEKLNTETPNKDRFILWKNEMLYMVYRKGGKNIQQETNGEVGDNHLGESGHIVQANLIYDHLMGKKNII
jgi:hypothetical protein